MAIADGKKKKIGRELVEWIHLGIEIGARQSVVEYHRYKVSNPVEAEGHLLRAVSMPVRARARINARKDIYEANNGVNTFNDYI